MPMDNFLMWLYHYFCNQQSGWIGHCHFFFIVDNFTVNVFVCNALSAFRNTPLEVDQN